MMVRAEAETPQGSNTPSDTTAAGFSPKVRIILGNGVMMVADVAEMLYAFAATCIGTQQVSYLGQRLDEIERCRVRSLLELRLHGSDMQSLVSRNVVEYLKRVSCDSLRINDQMLSAGSVASFCQILPVIPSLRTVNVSAVDLGGIDSDIFGRIVDASPQTKTYVFQDVDMESTAALSLAQALRRHTRVEILDVRLNPRIGETGARAILNAISSHVSLKSVLLDSGQVSPRMHAAILNGLERSHSRRSQMMVALCSKKRGSLRPILPNDLIRLLDEALHGRNVQPMHKPRMEKISRIDWRYLVRFTRFVLVQMLLIGLTLLCARASECLGQGAMK